MHCARFCVEITESGWRFNLKFSGALGFHLGFNHGLRVRVLLGEKSPAFNNLEFRQELLERIIGALHLDGAV
jgi:hypothetical protein